VSARSKAWVCDLSLAGIAGSNPDGAWMCVSCEWCVLSLRRAYHSSVSPTKRGVSSESDREATYGEAMTQYRVEAP
jgi:hypothetical protein